MERRDVSGEVLKHVSLHAGGSVRADYGVQFRRNWVDGEIHDGGVTPGVTMLAVPVGNPIRSAARVITSSVT